MSLRSDLEDLITRLAHERWSRDEFDQGKDWAWRATANDLREILAKNPEKPA